MEVDGTENHSALYDMAVVQAKSDILAGRAVRDIVPELQSRHEMLRDVVKEAKQLGRTRGAVLVACTGILRHLQRCSVDGDGADELSFLVALSAMYCKLYGRRCVVTSGMWYQALEETLETVPSACLESRGVEAGYRSRIDAWSAASKECRDKLKRESSSGDDGSVAEGDLRLLAKRCLQLGRKAGARMKNVRADSEEDGFRSGTLREMIRTLETYLQDSTLEW